MKRSLLLFTAFLMALTIFPAVSGAESFDPASVTTPYVCLMESETGAVLYEKNASEHAYPASTTKIMTCILALELAKDINETVTTGDNVETSGSCCNFSRNEELPLIDMLYGMMLRSGNDAAKAIAEHFAGSEADFAVLMNNKAAELGMTNTHFVKPNGLHKEEHYTTAHDMALLSCYAMKNETFRKIVATGHYKAAPTNKDSDGYEWDNGNKLIHTKEDEESFEYQYATGVKTGDTAYAGRCLVASAKKDGVELILVLFGDMENRVSGDYRFINAAKFFDWGFANFASLDAASLNLESTVELPVSNASLDDPNGGLLALTIDLAGKKLSGLKEEVSAITADPSLITTDYVLDKKLQAPIAEGEMLGTITYKYDGATLFSAPMYASRSVEEIGVVATSAPSSSPFVIDTPRSTEGDGEGSTLVFWLILAFVLILLIVVAKIISSKRRRRRAARRRKAYRSAAR